MYKDLTWLYLFTIYFIVKRECYSRIDTGEYH